MGFRKKKLLFRDPYELSDTLPRSDEAEDPIRIGRIAETADRESAMAPHSERGRGKLFPRTESRINGEAVIPRCVFRCVAIYRSFIEARARARDTSCVTLAAQRRRIRNVERIRRNKSASRASRSHDSRGVSFD